MYTVFCVLKHMEFVIQFYIGLRKRSWELVSMYIVFCVLKHMKLVIQFYIGLRMEKSERVPERLHFYIGLCSGNALRILERLRLGFEVLCRIVYTNSASDSGKLRTPF